MRFREFGSENSNNIILLHGGGLSWWNYRDTAELLKNDFHVVLPILDGHAESAAVIPSGLTNALIAPSFGASYGLIKNRTFAKMQFRSLHIRPDLFEDYYRDTCLIRKNDMIAFLKSSTSYEAKAGLKHISSRLSVFYGSKESGIIKRSAETIRNIVPSCQICCMSGYYHGDFSINHPNEYAKTIRNIINGENDNP